MIELTEVRREYEKGGDPAPRLEMQERTEETRLRSDLELLEKLLPNCSICRRVRDDKNEWWSLETYVREKTDTRFTTTLCPNCKKVSCSKK